MFTLKESTPTKIIGDDEQKKKKIRINIFAIIAFLIYFIRKNQNT